MQTRMTWFRQTANGDYLKLINTCYASTTTVLSGEPVHTADKLRSVLEKEINHETETYEGSPPDIDDFLAEAGWEVMDFFFPSM